MLAMTRTLCIMIMICSIALLTLNSSLPAPAENSPIWASNGGTHEISTTPQDGNHTIPARAAAFGPAVEELDVGRILSLPSGSNLGCSEEDYILSLNSKHGKTRPDPELQSSWILLVRGDCSFVDKVRLAQKAGYEGVVVGDDGSAYELLITMFARDTDDIRIPSLFITQSSYKLLLSSIPKDSDRLEIRIETSELRTDWPLLDTLIFICFSPLCTLLVVYIVLFIRRRKLHLNNILPPAYLSKLEVVEYMAKDGVNAECVICLENFEELEKVLELPCKHLYHDSCIRKWLIERKKICPICKRDVSVGIDVREGRLDESAIQSSLTTDNHGPLRRAEATTLATEDTPLLRSAATQTIGESHQPVVGPTADGPAAERIPEDLRRAAQEERRDQQRLSSASA